MKPHLVYRAAGSTADGVRYVTDTASLMRVDVVDGVPAPAGTSELTSAQIAAILAVVPTSWCALESLAPTTHTPLSFRTPDGVELSDAIVRMLRALEPPIQLGTSGPMGVVLVRSKATLVGAVMPLRPHDPPPPSPRRWRSREVFVALQRNRLLGEFDGGTWARHMERLHAAGAPTVAAMIERLDTLALDEREILDAVMTALAPSATAFTHGPRAAKDGVFIARDLHAKDADGIRAAIDELARAHGVTGVVVDDPLDMRAIYNALGFAFAAAGVPESVFLVGALEKMIVIRERLEPTGVFEVFAWWEPDLGPFAKHPLIGNVARALRTKGLTRITQVAAFEVAPLGNIPAFTVRVLRRMIADRPERAVVLLSDGLRARRLDTVAENSVVRFEIMTWADHFDEALLATCGQIGRLVFRVTEPGGNPFYPGQALRAEQPTSFMGWERVLLLELVAPLPAAGGDIDVLRVVPITAAEATTLAADKAAGASLRLVDALDAQSDKMLARWFEPPA